MSRAEVRLHRMIEDILDLDPQLTAVFPRRRQPRPAAPRAVTPAPVRPSRSRLAV